MNREIQLHGRSSHLSYVHGHADVSRRRPHGDRLQVPARSRWPPHPGRLRAVPGPQGAAPAQLVAAAGPSRDRSTRSCSPTRTSITRAGCRGWSRRASTGRSTAPAARPTCASWCCPTPRTCRKRTRSSPTSAASRSTRRRCRSTPKPTPPKRCRGCSRRRSARRSTSVDGIEVEFINAGHLLGSAYVLVTRADGSGATACCSAAISAATTGRSCPIRRPASMPMCCSLESTYGDRVHPDEDDGAVLARIINETCARRGKVIIPAFAIGRVEELLYWLFKLEDERPAAELPIYVDSPMAVKGIEYYQARTRRARPGDRSAMRPQAAAVHAGQLGAANRRRWSSTTRRPSSSPRAAWPPAAASCTICLPACPTRATPCCSSGFQAAGTRGRQLVEGARHVKMFGQHVPVHAQNREDRRHVGARRCRRDHPVAAHVPARAEDDLSRARRSRRRRTP